MKSGIVLVLGNSMHPEDALPLKLVDSIRKQIPTIQFIHWDPTEELPSQITKNLILIDSIKGITNIQVFTDLSKFTISPRNTVHDFDLPVALSLLQKIGRIQKITILGIPYGVISANLGEQLLTTLLSI